MGHCNRSTDLKANELTQTVIFLSPNEPNATTLLISDDQRLIYYTYIYVYIYIYIYMSLRRYVVMSLCRYVVMSLCRYVVMSLCVRSSEEVAA